MFRISSAIVYHGWVGEPMQALQLTEYRKLRLVDLPVPSPAPDEVLIRVAACGICGSDVHGYDGSTGRRIPPLVMGHEAAGVIAAVGKSVNTFAVGERVTFDSTISCGSCRFCKTGAVNLCDRREVLGVSCGDYRRNGAFAEYVAVPARIVYRLPDSLSFADAAMIEAVSVALHAVRLTAPEQGSTALIVGAGMIGLLILQALRVAGCERILVTDLDPHRLRLAKKLGATEVLEASAATTSEGIAEQVRGHDRRPRRGRSAGGCRYLDNSTNSHCLGSKRRNGHAGRQSCTGGFVAAAERRHTANSTARLVRVGGRISAGHRTDGKQNHRCCADALRRRSADGRTALV